MAELDLSGVDLAALSGFETGTGTEARGGGGEGLPGLQRALPVDGAGAATAATATATATGSLWVVPDEQTQALMVRFYQSYWARGGGDEGRRRSARPRRCTKRSSRSCGRGGRRRPPR